MHFSRRGYRVAVVDNFAKRQWELEIGVEPLFPIATLHERVRAWYVESAKRNPDRWVTVDAEQPREVIARIIEKCVLDMAPSGSVVSRRDGGGE
jgi:hypothetical protein